MWDKFSKKLKFFRLLAGGGLLILASSAPARAVNQNEAMLDADAKNRLASDYSLQHSTTYAMGALMDLGNLNMKSAVNNGMKAYGKYRNSQTMDKLGDINFNQANSMASVSANAPPPRKTETTYRRLDPSFMSKGEHAKVAAEFEKKSGMSRGQFLTQLADVSEQKIKRSDPQLMSKVFGTFENFVAKIPNKDFRRNLQKGMNLVPESVRAGVISKAIKDFSHIPAPEGYVAAPMPTAPAASAAPAMASAGPVDPVSPGPAAASAAGAVSAAREPASDSPGSSAGIGNIIEAAIQTQNQDPTIFQLVTRRYRLLTPALLP